MKFNISSTHPNSDYGNRHKSDENFRENVVLYVEWSAKQSRSVTTLLIFAVISFSDQCRISHSGILLLLLLHWCNMRKRMMIYWTVCVNWTAVGFIVIATQAKESYRKIRNWTSWRWYRFEILLLFLIKLDRPVVMLMNCYSIFCLGNFIWEKIWLKTVRNERYFSLNVPLIAIFWSRASKKNFVFMFLNRTLEKISTVLA